MCDLSVKIDLLAMMQKGIQKVDIVVTNRICAVQIVVYLFMWLQLFSETFLLWVAAEQDVI